MKKIIIAGAGPAGLMAAAAAARSGAQVTVLEAMERPGKKLLMTGNGRCNLTNLSSSLPDEYYGTGAGLASEIIRQFGVSQTRDFFAGLGLLTQERNGYVYPYTLQAASVLKALLVEISRLKVKVKFNEKVSAAVREDGVWQVKTASWQYAADALILACGSKAVPSTGSDGNGYLLAKQLGHTIIPPVPALVPLTCEGDFLPAAAGVRCRAAVSLYRKKKGERQLLKKDTGELQWTRYGISGIVVFQLSRFVSSDNDTRELYVSIDLFPEFEAAVLQKLLFRRSRLLEGETIRALLSGMVNEKLIPAILKKSKLSPGILCPALSLSAITDLVCVMKNFDLKVTGTKQFDDCQICAGGIDAREIISPTLESRKQKSLYFAGELVDVDGPCGGYNLQWAWSSGYMAGSSAAMPQSCF